MPHFFAIVPAAGQSTRMGQPKLLLPLEGRPLIVHALEAWQRGGVDRIVVVVRADDAPLLAAVESLQWPLVEVVQPPQPPPDMKASIQAALRRLESRWSPAADDCFLVAPADIPRLSCAVIAAVRSEFLRDAGRIVVPLLAGRRGHPVLFPWSLAQRVHALQPDEGLSALVDLGPTLEVLCDHLVPQTAEPFADIDTRDEYRRLAGE